MANAEFNELDWVINIFRSYNHPWFVCGGWALDLFLGHKTREHSDIEIGIFREDQISLQTLLKDWSLNCMEDGTGKGWKQGVFLKSPIHEIMAVSGTSKLEILLNEKGNGNWIYRRNNKIQLPLNNAIFIKDNFSFLCPEAVLLYKSKNIRPKDQQDFERALPNLNASQREWLKESIVRSTEVHPWIENGLFTGGSEG